MPRVAVIVAFWLVGIREPAAALNVAVLDPAATATEAGTVNKASLLVSESVEPPAGLGRARVTLQLELPDAFSAAGTHDSKEIVGCPAPPVTVPLAPVICIPVAAGDAASDPRTPMEVAYTPEAIIKFTTATVPFEIPLVFGPEIMQAIIPVPGTHASFLADEVNAVPGTTAIAVTLNGGYVKVH